MSLSQFLSLLTHDPSAEPSPTAVEPKKPLEAQISKVETDLPLQVPFDEEEDRMIMPSSGGTMLG